MHKLFPKSMPAFLFFLAPYNSFHSFYLVLIHNSHRLISYRHVLQKLLQCTKVASKLLPFSRDVLYIRTYTYRSANECIANENQWGKNDKTNPIQWKPLKEKNQKVSTFYYIQRSFPIFFRQPNGITNRTSSDWMSDRKRKKIEIATKKQQQQQPLTEHFILHWAIFFCRFVIVSGFSWMARIFVHATSSLPLLERFWLAHSLTHSSPPYDFSRLLHLLSICFEFILIWFAVRSPSFTEVHFFLRHLVVANVLYLSVSCRPIFKASALIPRRFSVLFIHPALATK